MSSIPTKANPPSHQTGQRGGMILVSASKERRMAITKTAPAMNHTNTRVAICTSRPLDRQGRRWLRNHTSTQCPPKEGHSARRAARGQRAGLPENAENATPNTAAIAPVRRVTERRDSRYGCQWEVTSPRNNFAPKRTGRGVFPLGSVNAAAAFWRPPEVCRQAYCVRNRNVIEYQIWVSRYQIWVSSCKPYLTPLEAGKCQNECGIFSRPNR